MKLIEIVANYGDICGEGPLWRGREQALYWTDIAGRRLYRCTWPERNHEMVHQGLEISGLALHESGAFVIVNSGGVWIWDLENKGYLVTDSIENKKCVLNDCIADPEGRLFTGSCFFDSHNDDDYQHGYLFRIDNDGTGHVVDEGIRLANGLGFSPDCSTLYFADSAERVIYAYDYRRADGSIRNRRTFVKVPSTEGLPDGLTVDAEGFVWSAQWFGGCIVRYDPDGKEQQRIRIPASQTSSLAFGGPDLTDIFITSARMGDALSLAPINYLPENGNTGGQIYHVDLGICGREEYEAKITASTTHKLPTLQA
ncbi:MAG: SMP-30/gluconolactonase/LRE family protein [Acidobacteriaceae bacterium]